MEQILHDLHSTASLGHTHTRTHAHTYTHASLWTSHVECVCDLWSACADVERYITIEKYTAEEEDELSFPKGVTVDVLQKSLDGWWLIKLDGKAALAPATFLMKRESSEHSPVCLHSHHIIMYMYVTLYPVFIHVHVHVGLLQVRL